MKWYKQLSQNVVALSVSSLLNSISSEMLAVLLPIYMAQGLKYSSSTIGITEGIAVLFACVIKIVAGTLVDKFQCYLLFTALGYLFAACSRVSLLIIPKLLAVALPWSALLFSKALDKIGKGLRSSPRDALLAASVHPTFRGFNFSIHHLAQILGCTISLIFALVLVSFHITKTTSSSTTTDTSTSNVDAVWDMILIASIPFGFIAVIVVAVCGQDRDTALQQVFELDRCLQIEEKEKVQMNKQRQGQIEQLQHQQNEHNEHDNLLSYQQESRTLNQHHNLDQHSLHHNNNSASTSSSTTSTYTTLPTTNSQPLNDTNNDSFKINFDHLNIDSTIDENDDTILPPQDDIINNFQNIASTPIKPSKQTQSIPNVGNYPKLHHQQGNIPTPNPILGLDSIQIPTQTIETTTPITTPHKVNPYPSQYNENDDEDDDLCNDCQPSFTYQLVSPNQSYHASTPRINRTKSQQSNNLSSLSSLKNPNLATIIDQNPSQQNPTNTDDHSPFTFSLDDPLLSTQQQSNLNQTTTTNNKPDSTIIIPSQHDIRHLPPNQRRSSPKLNHKGQKRIADSFMKAFVQQFLPSQVQRHNKHHSNKPTSHPYIGTTNPNSNIQPTQLTPTNSNQTQQIDNQEQLLLSPTTPNPPADIKTYPEHKLSNIMALQCTCSHLQSKIDTVTQFFKKQSLYGNQIIPEHDYFLPEPSIFDTTIINPTDYGSNNNNNSNENHLLSSKSLRLSATDQCDGNSLSSSGTNANGYGSMNEYEIHSDEEDVKVKMDEECNNNTNTTTQSNSSQYQQQHSNPNNNNNNQSISPSNTQPPSLSDLDLDPALIHMLEEKRKSHFWYLEQPPQDILSNIAFKARKALFTVARAIVKGARHSYFPEVYSAFHREERRKRRHAARFKKAMYFSLIDANHDLDCMYSHHQQWLVTHYPELTSQQQPQQLQSTHLVPQQSTTSTQFNLYTENPSTINTAVLNPFDLTFTNSNISTNATLMNVATPIETTPLLSFSRPLSRVSSQHKPIQSQQQPQISSNSNVQPLSTIASSTIISNQPSSKNSFSYSQLIMDIRSKEHKSLRSKQIYIITSLIGIISFGQVFSIPHTFLILLAHHQQLSIQTIVFIVLLYNTVYSLLTAPAGMLSDFMRKKTHGGGALTVMVGWVLRALIFIYLGYNCVEGASSIIDGNDNSTAGAINLTATTTTIVVGFICLGLYMAFVEGTMKALMVDVMPQQFRRNLKKKKNGKDLLRKLKQERDLHQNQQNDNDENNNENNEHDFEANNNHKLSKHSHSHRNRRHGHNHHEHDHGDDGEHDHYHHGHEHEHHTSKVIGLAFSLYDSSLGISEFIASLLAGVFFDKNAIILWLYFNAFGSVLSSILLFFWRQYISTDKQAILILGQSATTNRTMNIKNQSNTQNEIQGLFFDFTSLLQSHKLGRRRRGYENGGGIGDVLPYIAPNIITNSDHSILVDVCILTKQTVTQGINDLSFVNHNTINNQDNFSNQYDNNNSSINSQQSQTKPKTIAVAVVRSLHIPTKIITQQLGREPLKEDLSILSASAFRVANFFNQFYANMYHDLELSINLHGNTTSSLNDITHIYDSNYISDLQSILLERMPQNILTNPSILCYEEQSHSKHRHQRRSYYDDDDEFDDDDDDYDDEQSSYCVLLIGVDQATIQRRQLQTARRGYIHKP